MSHFRYRAITPAGDFVDGEVEAPSREEVIRRIEYLGHVTIEVEAATTSMLARSSVFRSRTPRPRDMTIFLRQLAVLVGAGLTLEAALQALGDDTGKAGVVCDYRTLIDCGGRQLCRCVGTPSHHH